MWPEHRDDQRAADVAVPAGHQFFAGQPVEQPQPAHQHDLHEHHVAGDQADDPARGQR